MAETNTGEKMNIQDYDKLVADFRNKGDEQARQKRVEYTESRGDEDVLANFKATAEDINMDSLQVLYTFMKKHWSSIANYIKTGNVFSDEPIEERIMDLIQYLELTYATIMEKKAEADVENNDNWETEVAFTDPPKVINKDTIRKGLQRDPEC